MKITGNNSSNNRKHKIRASGLRNGAVGLDSDQELTPAVYASDHVKVIPSSKYP